MGLEAGIKQFKYICVIVELASRHRQDYMFNVCSGQGIAIPIRLQYLRDIHVMDHNYILGGWRGDTIDDHGMHSTPTLGGLVACPPPPSPENL